MSTGADIPGTEERVAIRFRRLKEFEIEAGEHVLTSDQAVNDGGRDRGPTPAELFHAGVGASIASYVLSYLQARFLPTEGLELVTTWETGESRRRISRIRVQVKLPAGVPEVNHARILEAAERCLILLREPPEVTVELLGTAARPRTDAG